MDPIQRESSVDVAMFIDWENMHGFIRGKANISALREVAEGYGRLVLAKAYADWREQRFQRDSQFLYQIGIEPVYVPTGYKNNADVKLATDCIDLAYRNPSIETYILVTGDGDFVHVATALRPRGKKVIVIAQSNNASTRLGDLVDTLLIYDIDVDPPKVGDSPGHPKDHLPVHPPSADVQAAKNTNKVFQDANEVFQQIVKFIEHETNNLLLLTQVKMKLIGLYGKFDQHDYGFEKFKSMMEHGESEGYFSLHTAGLRDWLTLPQKNHKQTAIPEELEEIFKEIAETIRVSKREGGALFPYIKSVLLQKYGGFDESIYGYRQFKQLMEEGANLGYFRIEPDDHSGYKAFVD